MTEPSNSYRPPEPKPYATQRGAEFPYPSRRTLGGSTEFSQGQPAPDGTDRFLPPTEPGSSPSASSETPTNPYHEPSRRPTIQVSSRGEATLPGQFEPRRPVSPGIPQRPANTVSPQAATGAPSQQGVAGGFAPASTAGGAGFGGSGFSGGPGEPGGTGSSGGPGGPRDSSGQGKRRGPGWFGVIVAMLLTSAATIAAVFAISSSGFDFDFFQSPESSTEEDTNAAGELQSGSNVVPPVTETVRAPDWQAVAEAVRPATVSIRTEGVDSAAAGSGVIIDDAGHIVSNYHVVSGAENGGSITVTTFDGQLFDASIVGVDSTTDLAVIQMETVPEGLTAARLGSSEDLEVGQPVMAIGAPLGLADTTTTGIISALNRPVAVQGQTDGNSSADEVVVTNAIQVDASINPGNSGGPLFDEQGAVIGINFSIASVETGVDTAGSIGLGFAIPVDLVQSVVNQIITTGSAQHALLGVEIQTVSVNSGDGQRLGAGVATVVPGGAADSAGLMQGDVIVAIDGNPVTSGSSLTGYVRRYSPGQEVTLTVVRGGVEENIEATLQER